MTEKTDKKKVLFIVVIVIAILLISIAFVTSTTYTQLAIASLLYPPLAYFAFKNFPGKRNRKETKRLVLESKTKSKAKRESVEIVDIDKRAFLKMLGAAGFSFFIFSLFTRRVEDFILNKNSGNNSFGNPNDVRNTSPVEPTEGYRVTEISTEEYNYYGFVNKEGNWYIMREDPTAGSFRYVKGDLNFSKGWVVRDGLEYDYFHNVFN